MPIDPSQPLRPQLDRLEEELQDNIDDVCDSPRVEQIDTGELIRVEEVLSLAADAAKSAVSLRRRMHRDSDRESDRDRPADEGDAAP